MSGVTLCLGGAAATPADAALEAAAVTKPSGISSLPLLGSLSSNSEPKLNLKLPSSAAAMVRDGTVIGKTQGARESLQRVRSGVRHSKRERAMQHFTSQKNACSR